MDHIFAGQSIGFRDLRLARFAPVQKAALRQKLRTRSPVNGSVHAASPQKTGIGSVHDGCNAMVFRSEERRVGKDCRFVFFFGGWGGDG